MVLTTPAAAPAINDVTALRPALVLTLLAETFDPLLESLLLLTAAVPLFVEAEVVGITGAISKQRLLEKEKINFLRNETGVF